MSRCLLTSNSLGHDTRPMVHLNINSFSMNEKNSLNKMNEQIFGFDKVFDSVPIACFHRSVGSGDPSA